MHDANGLEKLPDNGNVNATVAVRDLELRFTFANQSSHNEFITKQ